MYLAKLFPQKKKHDIGMSRVCNHTVGGKNPAPVEVGSLSHYLQGFIRPRVVVWDFSHQQDVANDSQIPKSLAPSAPFGLKKVVPKTKNTAFATRCWGVFFNGISSSPPCFFV